MNQSPQLMNEYFICIKVDREERPDVDDIYMTAVQIMTRVRWMATVGVVVARYSRAVLRWHVFPGTGSNGPTGIPKCAQESAPVLGR